MKYLFLMAMLLMGSPVFSHCAHDSKCANDEESITDERMETFSKCEFSMIDDGLSPQAIIALLKEGSKTRFDEIADIDSGSNTTSSVSGNYVLIATIYGRAFGVLAHAPEYEDAIYNVEKENTIDEEWRSKHSNWQLQRSYGSLSSIAPKTEEDYLEVFPKRTKRIENPGSFYWKKEYVVKAKPYIYIIKKEKRYYELARVAAVKEKSPMMIDMTTFCVNAVNDSLKLARGEGDE